MGGRWKVTYFYLNKADKYPVMSVSWHSAADLIGNGYTIERIFPGSIRPDDPETSDDF